MRKTIGINFTITRWVGSWKRTVIDSVTDHRNSSANWDEKREGKILPAWKTRPMCLHGLLFNLIGLLGEKLCTEPLPVEGKTVLQTRVSSQASRRALRRLSYLLHLLESKRSDGWTSRRFQTRVPVYFSWVNLQPASQPEIKLDIQLSRVLLFYSLVCLISHDSHNCAGDMPSF